MKLTTSINILIHRRCSRWDFLGWPLSGEALLLSRMGEVGLVLLRGELHIFTTECSAAESPCSTLYSTMYRKGSAYTAVCTPCEQSAVHEIRSSRSRETPDLALSGRRSLATSLDVLEVPQNKTKQIDTDIHKYHLATFSRSKILVSTSLCTAPYSTFPFFPNIQIR